MHIQKQIFLFIITFLYPFTSYATDTNIPNITLITYEGNLSDDTTIELKGTNFSNCENFLINNKKLVIDEITKDKITYSYGKNKELKGHIEFYCNNILVSSNFAFPYISDFNVKTINNKYKLGISGYSFKDNTELYTASGTRISLDNKSDNYIEGKLPETLSTKYIYIKSEGLKSNIFNLDVLIPKINYIYSENGFIGGNTVTIYGEDFFSDRVIIKIGDYTVDNFIINEDKKSITFTLPKIFGDYKLYIELGGIKSNELDLEILGELPHIDNIFTRGERIGDNGEGEYIERLYIKGNFPFYNNSDSYIYHNGTRINATEISKKELIFNDFELNKGDNFFYVVINGYKSNVIKLNNYTSKAYISFIEKGKLIDNKRVFNIGVGNFDEEKDKFYLNESNVNIKSCLLSSCKVLVNNNILSGYFHISDGNYRSIEKKIDIKLDNIPIINQIIFDGELKHGTKFTIKGKNFTNSNLSITNLVSKNEHGKYNVNISDTEIVGYIEIGYDITKNTKITIDKFSESTSLNFTGKDINGNSVNGAGYIDKVINETGDYILKPGKKAIIKGYGFHSGDTISIGDKKIPLLYTSIDNGSFTIPSDLKSGKHSIKIENTEGLTSSTFDIYIFETNSKGELVISTEKDDNTIYYINTDYSDKEFYTLSIDNQINNFLIKSIKFKFSNKDDDFNNLGTYYLILDGKKISEGIVDKSGFLNFSDILIDKSFNQHSLVISKSSDYLKAGSYDFTLDKIELYIDGTSTKFNNIDKKGLVDKKFNILKKEAIKCIDSTNDKLNCDPSDNTINNTSNVIKKEETNSKIETENPTQKVYDRIDNITEDLVKKISDESSIYKLNYFKNLRLKITKVINNKPKSKSRIFLEYFYDKVDIKFKIAFKEHFGLDK